MRPLLPVLPVLVTSSSTIMATLMSYGDRIEYDQSQNGSTCRSQSKNFSVTTAGCNGTQIYLKKYIPPLRILVEDFLQTLRNEGCIQRSQEFSHIVGNGASQDTLTKSLSKVNLPLNSDVVNVKNNSKNCFVDKPLTVFSNEVAKCSLSNQNFVSESQEYSQIVADHSSQIAEENSSQEALVKSIKGINHIACANNINEENSLRDHIIDKITPSVTCEAKKFKSMRYEANRLETFKNKWPLSFLPPDVLAAVGFFYLQTDDQVQCAFCRGIVIDWSPGDDPLVEHARHFPLCPFLLMRDVGNIPISGSKYSQSGLTKSVLTQNVVSYKCTNDHYWDLNFLSHPKFPTMADLEKRLGTFSMCKNPFAISCSVLAEAGFYYTGVLDITTCFHCGGKLESWQVDDDPWIEHAKHFPKCVFLQSQQNNRGQFLGESDPVTDMKVSNWDVQNLMKGNVAQEALQIFSEDLIRTAFEKQLGQKGKPFESLDDLCNAVLEMQNQSKLSSETSDALKNGVGSMCDSNHHLCKICLDKEMDVVFLPCRHLLSCSECSSSIAVCPLCRSPIEQYIKTYIS